jgi:3-methyladenine DNA glycosylase AlkD
MSDSPILSLAALHREVKNAAEPKKGAFFQRFFKTGPGQYAEGDLFCGLTVPQVRELVRRSGALTVENALKLLQSKIHEERLLALILLVKRFEKGSDAERKKIYTAYLANTKYINNWDLVDTSAYSIVGTWLLDKNIAPLRKLAQSKNLWERRIAIVATLAFIRKGQSEPTIMIAKMLLKDSHDLIHKASGWMLREVGKRCSEKELRDFLDEHATVMPRTMLRYAVERLSPTLRRRYTSL